MKTIKNILRNSAIILMIVAASIGAGIGGAIIPPKYKREGSEINIELVEIEDKQEDEDEMLQ